MTNPTTHDFLKRVQGIFFDRLDKKTGWGRNEIRRAYLESVAEAAYDIVATRPERPSEPPKPHPPGNETCRKDWPPQSPAEPLMPFACDRNDPPW